MFGFTRCQEVLKIKSNNSFDIEGFFNVFKVENVRLQSCFNLTETNKE